MSGYRVPFWGPRDHILGYQIPFLGGIDLHVADHRVGLGAQAAGYSVLEGRGVPQNAASAAISPDPSPLLHPPSPGGARPPTP